MGPELRTARPAVRAKRRNPGAIVILSMVTLSLYSIYWWYAINRELRDLGQSRGALGLGESPGLSMIAYALGGCLVIPFVWTAVTTNRRIERGQELVGVADASKSWVAVGLLTAALLIALVGAGLNSWALGALLVSAMTLEIGAMVYMQISLNEIWRTTLADLEPGSQLDVAVSTT